MTPLFTVPRALACVMAVSVALVLQASLFSHLAVHGVVPDLVLLVVVAAALAYGSELGLVLGFAAGLLLDLAPPADHVAGRWALALMVVGYVAGRLAVSGGAYGSFQLRGQLLRIGVIAAAASFVGTSVFALSGLLLRDPAVGVGELLRVELVSVGWDVALALVVVPLTLGLFAKVEPDRVLA
jgi:rod shape-determining protein MreD